jgi:hypothetical protein
MKKATKTNFSRNRRTISAYMKIANSIPFTHMTTEIKVPGLKPFCLKHGVTYTIVIIKTIAALKEKYPIMNSILGRDFILTQIPRFGAICGTSQNCRSNKNRDLANLSK